MCSLSYCIAPEDSFLPFISTLEVLLCTKHSSNLMNYIFVRHHRYHHVICFLDSDLQLAKK